VRAVVQRVREARVSVADSLVGAIGPGLCVLLGVADGDGPEKAVSLARNIARLRIFPNAEGRFDLSLLDTGGGALVISQFTLIADTTRGQRPSFTDAASPDHAEEIYELFVQELRQQHVTVATGSFGAAMAVELINDGPVTLVLDR
jgi:D-tyrosyl-tRNA(Tyr) deacylase